MPIKRSIIRDTTKKPINHLDIHWRNTPLLSKYVTAASTIKSRFNTRLPKWQQRRMADAIKYSRRMNLMPYTGFMKSYHKRPLLSIHHDAEARTTQKIDIYTGGLKIDQPGTEWNENTKGYTQRLEDLDNYDETIDLSSYNLTNLRFLTKDQDKLVKATRYANYLKEQSLDPQELLTLKSEQKTYWMLFDNKNFEAVSTSETMTEDQTAYDDIVSRFDQLSPIDFIEARLAESALDFNRLEELNQESSSYNEEIRDMDKDELMDELENFKREAGIEWKNSFKL